MEKIIKAGLFFAFIAGIGLSSGSPCCLAAETGESIHIVTYYPSPYGVYMNLKSRRLAVGDANNDGVLNDADLPDRDGDIRLTPQSGNPSSWHNGEEGQVAYSHQNSDLYYYDGSDWVAGGGSGSGEVTYIYYCFQINKYGTPVCTDAGGTQGYCPSGYRQKAALGEWGVCKSTVRPYGGGSWFIPPGGSCHTDEHTHAEVLGRAYVCSSGS